MKAYDQVYCFRAHDLIDNTERVKAEIIPEREDLVAFYKMLMKDGALSGSISETSRKMGIKTGIMVMSGLILKDLNLIDFSMSGHSFEAKMRPKPKRKIDIFEAPFFKRLQDYRRMSYREVMQIEY